MVRPQLISSETLCKYIRKIGGFENNYQFYLLQTRAKTNTCDKFYDFSKIRIVKGLIVIALNSRKLDKLGNWASVLVIDDVI